MKKLQIIVLFAVSLLTFLCYGEGKDIYYLLINFVGVSALAVIINIKASTIVEVETSIIIRLARFNLYILYLLTLYLIITNEN